MNSNKTKPRRNLLVCLLALALVGCATTPPAPDTSVSHPANAHAASGVPPPVPTLMNITNLVMVKPVTEPAPEHQHGHPQHETKPKVEEKK
jgi:PBP1b-binding outer membrane lipoprotein LpoB